MLKKSLFLLCVVLTLCLFACTKDMSPEDRKATLITLVITEVDPSLLNMPLYVGLKKGFFAQQGLQIELKSAPSGEEALAGLLAGETDLILTGPEILFYQNNKVDNPVILPLAATAKANGYFLIAREHKSPFVWQNIKGKVVLGCKNGDLPEILFEYILENNDLHPLTDVSIVQNLPPQLVPGAFKAGSGHFLIVPEPAASMIEEQGSGKVVFSLELSAQQLVTKTILVSPAFMDKQKEVCQKFIFGLSESLQWLYTSSPEEISSLSSENIGGINERILLRSVSRYKTLGVWPHSCEISAKELENLQDIMERRKEIDNKTDVNCLIKDNYFQYSIVPSSG